jgi:hypothetical protein
LVTEPVPNSSNIAPRQTWTKRFRLLTKAQGCFADDLKFAFNSGYRFRIPPE